MNFIEFVEQERQERLDPFLLFSELSEIYCRPLPLIITAFVKQFQPLPSEAHSSYKFYSFDSIKGLNELESYKDMENCTDYLKMIVDGYDRVIFSDDYDITKEYWGLEHKEAGFDYTDSFGRLIPHNPFYFKRSDIKLFLEYSKITLPPCITEEVIDNTNNDYINKDDKLQQRINQLEHELEEQRKINSGTVYIPPLNIDNTGNLESENTQLKIDNKKLTEQLNNANKEIEELKKIVPILLGQYKNDDLLLLAIKARDKYWSNYIDTDPNYKSFSAEQIRRSIKKEFNHLSDRELNAIEFVSCPINRKK